MQLDLAPFLVISILLILIPGPDTAVVTKNALLGGRRGGVLSAAGVAIGLAIWTLAAALGIAALLRASSVAFLALKLAGALYLVWMGVQMLGTIFCALTLLWLAACGVLVGHGASFLRRPPVRRALDRCTGVVLIAFGVRLAFERR